MDHIMIWKFNDAPEAFRNLSDFNGREVWLTFVPKMYVGWAEELKPKNYDIHVFPWGKYGALIYVGASVALIG
jgi:hypothetical protein